MLRQLLLTSTITLVLGCSGAIAQEATVPDAGGTDQSQPLQPKPAVSANGAVNFINQQQDGQWLASDFIGQSVQSADGQSLGEVADLIFDKEEGGAVGVVISSGGFLGMGERRIAVPMEAVNRSMNENGAVILTLATDPENMQAAPVFMTLAEKMQADEQQRLLQQQNDQQNGLATPGSSDQ